MLCNAELHDWDRFVPWDWVPTADFHAGGTPMPFRIDCWQFLTTKEAEIER